MKAEAPIRQGAVRLSLSGYETPCLAFDAGKDAWQLALESLENVDGVEVSMNEYGGSYSYS
eukprot:7157-Eustigmatos_ZCMA.PRE.1